MLFIYSGKIEYKQKENTLYSVYIILANSRKIVQRFGYLFHLDDCLFTDKLKMVRMYILGIILDKRILVIFGKIIALRL